MHSRKRTQAHSGTDLVERWRVAFVLNEVGNEVVNFALPLGECHTRISVTKKRRIVNENCAKLLSFCTRLGMAPKVKHNHSRRAMLISAMDADFYLGGNRFGDSKHRLKSALLCVSGCV